MAQDFDNNGMEVDVNEHPANQGFNRTGFGIQHTLGKALKYGAIGLLIGAVALPALALVATGVGLGGFFTAAITAATALIPGAGSFVMGPFVQMAMNLGPVAGLLGLAIGGVVGASGAQDAIYDEEERRVTKYERGEVRQERVRALEQRHAQQAMQLGKQTAQMGLNPNISPNIGMMGQQQGRGFEGGR